MNMFNTSKYNNNEQVAQAYADSGYFFSDNKMWSDAVESLKLSLNRIDQISRGYFVSLLRFILIRNMISMMII